MSPGREGRDPEGDRHLAEGLSRGPHHQLTPHHACTDLLSDGDGRVPVGFGQENTELLAAETREG